MQSMHQACIEKLFLKKKKKRRNTTTTTTAKNEIDDRKKVCSIVCFVRIIILFPVLLLSHYIYYSFTFYCSSFY